jgi:predicted nucleic acid-binding protein
MTINAESKKADAASLLIDTNVVLASIEAGDPHFASTALALSTLRRRRRRVLVTAQILIEFYRVCTRPPSERGLGMTPAQAAKQREDILHLYGLLDETPAIFNAWKSLVDTAQVRGKQVHDARLVAVCHAHNIDAILTFNTTDFDRFEKIGPGILVISPKDI